MEEIKIFDKFVESLFKIHEAKLDVLQLSHWSEECDLFQKTSKIIFFLLDLKLPFTFFAKNKLQSYTLIQPKQISNSFEMLLTASNMPEYGFSMSCIFPYKNEIKVRVNSYSLVPNCSLCACVCLCVCVFWRSNNMGGGGLVKLG